MRLSFLLVSFIMVCMTFGVRSHAGGQIPVGFAPFPPFEFMNDDEMVGSDLELVQLVLEKSGYQPIFSARPWKRILEESKKGQYAIIFSLTKNKEREKTLLFSDPINTVKDVFYKRVSDQIEWKSLNSLSGLVISASHGYNYAPSFMSYAADSNSRISWAHGSHPEYEHLKRLKDGLVDVALCEVSVCQYLIKSNGNVFDGLDYIDKNVGPTRTFHAAIHKSWPNAEDLLQSFNKALREVIESGERDRIFKKYGIQISRP